MNFEFNGAMELLGIENSIDRVRIILTFDKPKNIRNNLGISQQS
ncbi:MAG TPA: hypothetical protein VIY98_13090 [Nitrososphaeraceae archaeon]